MQEKIALNYGTLKHLKIEEALQHSLKAGYQGFGAWMLGLKPFLEQKDGIKYFAKIVKDSGLKIVELDFLRDWLFAEGEQKKEAIKEAVLMCETAKAIGAECICAAAFGDDGPFNLAVKNFTDICDVANEYGVKVAFEFLPWQKFKTVSMAMDLVSAADKDNGGILVDTFHFFKGGSKVADLTDIPTEKIFLVHLSDFPLKKTEDDLLTQTRNYRVYPGLGGFDLQAFLCKLKEKKYQGYYSLEILNSSLAEMDALTVAQDALSATQVLFEKINKGI